MDENIVEVLVLYDGKHPACYVTKFEFFGSSMEMIGKLREPHSRIYQFRSICLEDLDEWEEEGAWYEVNTAFVPQPFDPRRFEFIDAFDLLWKRGREVFSSV